MGHIPVNFTSKLHCLVSHCGMWMPCCNAICIAYGEMLLQRSCKTSGNNTEVEGFAIVYRGERERAVSFVHLRKWMCECFTLHLLGLHRFVTTLCTCVTPLVPVEWNQIASCCACLCGSASLSVWPPCRFLDQFCRLLQFSVPLIQFWLGHAGASSCSAFSSGGSNATFSLLHCNQLSTCLMNLGRTPLLHSACTIHSNIKEEMAGA